MQSSLIWLYSCFHTSKERSPIKRERSFLREIYFKCQMSLA